MANALRMESALHMDSFGLVSVVTYRSKVTMCALSSIFEL